MAEDGDQDEASKTEDPTPKKLEEARKRGQVPQSKELNTWIMLLGATILIGLMSDSLFSDFRDYLKIFLEQPELMASGPGGIGAVLYNISMKTIGLISIPLLALFVAALVGPMAQVGFMIAPEVLKMDFSKVSIIKGFGRLFSIRSVVEFVKGLLKLSIIATVAFTLVHPYLGALEHTMDQSVGVMLENLHAMTMRMMIGILVALLMISIADVLYQRWEFNKQMRMTKQEIKDEYKQTEGDPYIKGKLKQLRFEKARQRMMQAVPKADVIITNPTHFAVALKYDPDKMDAPTLIAKGVDNVAFRIREIAKDNNIEIVENPPLARTLYADVDLDQPIPQELFKAVAEVISFVFQKRGKLPKR